MEIKPSSFLFVRRVYPTMPEQPDRYVSISERLMKLELNRGFFDIKVNDIPIWERIRYWTQQKILSELGIIDSGTGDSAPDKSPVRMYLSRIVEAGLGLVRKNPYLTTGNQVFVWGHQRRKKLDNTWWDIYFDPLYEQTPIDYIHVERKYNDAHRTPAKTENLRYLDVPDFIYRLSRKAGVATFELSSVENRDLKEIEQAIGEEFDVDIDISKKVEDLMSARIIWKPLYRSLLRRVDPKVVLLVISYFRETFVEVAKEENIPVVEVQHGSPTRYQFGYSYPGPRRKHNFPDYLFTFGEYWADTVPFPIENSRIFPVGYPYLEQQAAKISNSGTRDQIVVISQPAIGNELAALTVELSHSEAIPHKIVFKLHPSETDGWDQQYPRLADSGVQVVGDEYISLYELFAASTIQIGVYSTALYEGIHFGLQTFVYEAPGAQQMSDIVERGYAQRASSVADIEIKIGNLESEAMFDTEKMFRPNAGENMLHAICKVISDYEGK